LAWIGSSTSWAFFSHCFSSRRTVKKRFHSKNVIFKRKEIKKVQWVRGISNERSVFNARYFAHFVYQCTVRWLTVQKRIIHDAEILRNKPWGEGGGDTLV
jgi:hypothetical protein